MDTSKLTSTKLEKGFYKSLPFWSRVKNKVLGVSEFGDGIFRLFEMVVAGLVILPFLVVFGPFVLLCQLAGYYIFRKR